MENLEENLAFADLALLARGVRLLLDRLRAGCSRHHARVVRRRLADKLALTAAGDRVSIFDARKQFVSTRGVCGVVSRLGSTPDTELCDRRRRYERAGIPKYKITIYGSYKEIMFVVQQLGLPVAIGCTMQ
ncbi:unnamed protein product [Spodoptera exigua]|nr:unnamed protein product [Spodoptera exigua]